MWILEEYSDLPAAMTVGRTVVTSTNRNDFGAFFTTRSQNVTVEEGKIFESLLSTRVTSSISAIVTEQAQSSTFGGYTQVVNSHTLASWSGTMLVTSSAATTSRTYSDNFGISNTGSTTSSASSTYSSTTAHRTTTTASSSKTFVSFTTTTRETSKVDFTTGENGVTTTTASTTQSWIAPIASTAVNSSLITSTTRSVQLNPERALRYTFMTDCERFFLQTAITSGDAHCICDIRTEVTGFSYEGTFGTSTVLSTTTAGSTASAATTRFESTVQMLVSYMAQIRGQSPPTILTPQIVESAYRPYSALEADDPVYMTYAINVATSATSDTTRSNGTTFAQSNITQVLCHPDDTLVMESQIEDSTTVYTEGFGGYGWATGINTMVLAEGCYSVTLGRGTSVTSSVFRIDSEDTYTTLSSTSATTLTGSSLTFDRGVTARISSAYEFAYGVFPFPYGSSTIFVSQC